MSDYNFDKFSQYFNNWQKNLINFTLNRNLVNKEHEKYIKSFQTIDSEIYKGLFTAKEYYNKKLHYYNQKIKNLKQKEIAIKQHLDYVNKENLKALKDDTKEVERMLKALIKSLEKKRLDP